MNSCDSIKKSKSGFLLLPRNIYAFRSGDTTYCFDESQKDLALSNNINPLTNQPLDETGKWMSPIWDSWIGLCRGLQIKESYINKLIEKLSLDESINFTDPREIIYTIQNADPTKNCKYVKWIILSYLLGGIVSFEDIQTRVRPILEDFEILKDVVPENEASISNYCGLIGCNIDQIKREGLKFLIDKYKIELEKYKVDNKGELVYEDDSVKIFHPLTEESYNFYVKETEWYTGDKKMLTSSQLMEKIEITVIDMMEQSDILENIPSFKKIENEKLNMIIKNVANPTSLLPGGKPVINYLSFFYLIMKHRDVCSPLVLHPLPSDLFSKGHHHLSIYIFNKCPDRKKGIYEWSVPNSYFDNFKQCISQKYRFVISRLTLRIKHSSGHANGLLYDTQKMTLERFEPHGSDSSYNKEEFDQIVQMLFKNAGIEVKQYYRPLDFCPKLSFQSLEQQSKRRRMDPGGFCAYWSIWYLDMRLSNPDINPDKLIMESIRTIENNYDGFKAYIRSYAVFIYYLQQKVVEQLGTMKEFIEYNIIGELYILVPKYPQYEGEKYQININLDTYVNEKNEQEKIGKLFEKFPEIMNFEIFKDRYTSILIIDAVKEGNVDTLKKLRKDYGLTTEDARSNNNQALRYAAISGNCDILTELREGYGLTTEDARSNNNRALRYAALKGHVKVLKELREGYGLTTEDARSYNNQALQDAASNGNIDILKELREGYGLTTEDARDNDNFALYEAIEGGNIDVLKELREGYGLNENDVRQLDPINLMDVLLHIDQFVYEELIKGYGIDPSYFPDEEGY